MKTGLKILLLGVGVIILTILTASHKTVTAPDTTLNPERNQSEILAIPEKVPTENEMSYTGKFIIGHEVRTFSPCNSDLVYWITSNNDLPQITSVYDTETKNDEAYYTPILVRITGSINSAPAADGFAADYDGTIDITSINMDEEPEGCEITESSTTQSNQTTEAKPEQEDLVGFGGLIGVTDFDSKLASGEYVVLDVRTPLEYNQSRITDDALLVNFYDSDFRESLDTLDKDQKYLLHCRSGSRSSKTVPILQELGFSEFYELSGGIVEWNKGR